MLLNRGKMADDAGPATSFTIHLLVGESMDLTVQLFPQ
jgi:hypothetical protein